MAKFEILIATNGLIRRIHSCQLRKEREKGRFPLLHTFVRILLEFVGCDVMMSVDHWEQWRGVSS